jgi:hypothetical protein
LGLAGGGDAQAGLPDGLGKERLPLHACDLLKSLKAGAIETKDELIRRLQAVQELSSTIPRWRKLAAAMMTAIAPMVFGFVMVANIQYIENQFRGIHPDVLVLGACLDRLHEIRADSESPDADLVEEKRALETYVVVHFAQALEEGSDLRKNRFVNQLYGHLITVADDCVSNHPEPTPEEITWATEQVEPFLEPIRSRTHIIAPPLNVFLGNFSLVYIIVALFSVASFTFTRGGILPQLFGMAIVSDDGSRASRLRCLTRALVAWLPLLALLAWLLTNGGLGNTALGLSFGALVAGALWLVVRRRSIQDWVARTNLVAE